MEGFFFEALFWGDPLVTEIRDGPLRKFFSKTFRFRQTPSSQIFWDPSPRNFFQNVRFSTDPLVRRSRDFGGFWGSRKIFFSKPPIFDRPPRHELCTFDMAPGEIAAASIGIYQGRDHLASAKAAQLVLLLHLDPRYNGYSARLPINKQLRLRDEPFEIVIII